MQVLRKKSASSSSGSATLDSKASSKRSSTYLASDVSVSNVQTEPTQPTPAHDLDLGLDVDLDAVFAAHPDGDAVVPDLDYEVIAGIYGYTMTQPIDTLFARQ